MMPNILAAHALSECDTVRMEWKWKWNGNGKPAVVKALKNDIMLLAFANDTFCAGQKGPIFFYPAGNIQKSTALWKQGRCGDIMYLKIIHQHQNWKVFLQQVRPSWEISRRLYGSICFSNMVKFSECWPTHPYLILLITFGLGILVHHVWYQELLKMIIYSK